MLVDIFGRHLLKVSTVAASRQVIRNDETEFKAKRQYYKSKSRIPLQDGHHDRDSDDESTNSWYHEYRDAVRTVFYGNSFIFVDFFRSMRRIVALRGTECVMNSSIIVCGGHSLFLGTFPTGNNTHRDDWNRQNLDDYIDVEPKERDLMKMWNRFMGCSPATVADNEIPSKVRSFLTIHGTKLKQFEWEIYQLMITFWEHRLLSSENVEELMIHFHQIVGTT
jgi:hypothetical protein